MRAKKEMISMKSMKDLKRFSPEWWQNLWFFYKWHFLVGLIVVVAVVLTVIGSINRVEPDIHILFAGDYVLTEEDTAILKERIESTITDVNGDGKTVAQFLEISIKLDTERTDESTAPNFQQLRNQFVTGKQHILVLDRELFNLFYNQALIDTETLFEMTSSNPLFEGTNLANRDALMVTRYKRQDIESDFTTSQQVIDRWATK